MNAAYIELPFNPEEVFGKKRVKIKAWFDGELYRSTLMRMGMECDWIGITQEVRNKINKNPGDPVHVIVEEDREERIVPVPEDLQALFLTHKAEADFFSTLSFTHRKEYVRWIEEAKRPETRQSRLSKTIVMLSQKKKNPSEK